MRVCEGGFECEEGVCYGVCVCERMVCAIVCVVGMCERGYVGV